MSGDIGRMSAPAHSSDAAGWRLENSYASLPRILHAPLPPTPAREPRLVVLNHSLARDLGLDPAALSGPDGAELFAGNRLPPGAAPLAQAYAGHQYGNFTPLGDGRALLLGEQITPLGGRFDIQLKGSGPTPYSRRGDGRAALGPMLREYVVSEAMHALGIATTRSLAVVATGEQVWRQEGPLPGAVLTRVAASHIRVGTFEWAAAVANQAGDEALRALCDYTLRRHYPELADAAAPALALLDAVVEHQAELIARWMSVGFVHGVMNTDNMALSGETIDYGPCAFIDAYDPATVFSSIDQQGRYAYGNQPRIAQWNLARLAETLLPLLHREEEEAVKIASAAIQRFSGHFLRRSLATMRRKLGLFDEEPEDQELIESLLGWMQRTQADFTNSFAALSSPDTEALAALSDAEFQGWHTRWRARLARQAQSPAESLSLRRAANPAVIPRNHLVEAALAAAVQGELGPFQRLLEILAAPYDHERVAPDYKSPAPKSLEAYRTFCGT
jgi:serine/tyrosine/threonine adenylyltransferase